MRREFTAEGAEDAEDAEERTKKQNRREEAARVATLSLEFCLLFSSLRPLR
jgi:hypothetical protein